MSVLWEPQRVHFATTFNQSAVKFGPPCTWNENIKWKHWFLLFVSLQIIASKISCMEASIVDWNNLNSIPLKGPETDMIAFSVTMLWLSLKTFWPMLEEHSCPCCSSTDITEVTQGDLPAFGNINIKAGCNQVILVSFPQQFTMLCVVWCSFDTTSSYRNNWD